MQRTPFVQNGWFPESEFEESLNVFFQNGNYFGQYPWEDTDKPPVIRWEDFRSDVEEKARLRDRERAQGKCNWPWIIAESLGIPWTDPDQGSLGTCAGFAADSASMCMLLQHLSDGIELKFVASNPYPAWVLGRSDANYRGGGASLSMVLNGINKYGRFPISRAGTYAESVRKNIDWKAKIDDAEPFQVGCSYLGHLSSRELADAILLCVRAGHPVAFGGSTAVSNTPVHRDGVKTGSLRGSWMHATAFIAYRELEGKIYLAHLNSWGNSYGLGKYERDPGSVIWLSEEQVREMCSGRYRDAFTITYAESVPGRKNWKLSPLQIPFPVAGNIV